MLVELPHDPVLVVLSVCLAVAAAHTGLDLAARAAPGAPPRARLAWIVAASLAMGGGIWSMHVMGLFALGLPGDTGLAVALALLSLLLPVGFSCAALALGMTRGRPLLVSAASGLLLAAGSVATLYAWMPALPADGWPPDSPAPVVAALPVAAAAALAIAVHRAGLGFLPRFAAAGALGAALAVMHLAALAGVRVPAQLLDANTAYPAVAVAGATLIILVMGIAASVSDRRAAAAAARETEALRASEERYVSLYRNSPLPLHTLALDGTVEQVSDAWLALLDRTREEVLGRPLAEFMDPESARRRTGADAAVLAAEGRLHEVEYGFVRRDGTRLDVLLSAQLEPNPAGPPRRTLEGLVDVTQRRAAEQALRQAQKMEAIGQLTGGIAHDFNNLLTVIGGSLDLLERGRKPAALHEAMRNAVRQAAHLTRQLLTFSRTQPLSPEVVDVSAALDRVRGMLVQLLPPDIRLTTQVEPGLWRVEIDPNQFEVALVNLVINARDAMPAGGRIEIAARNEATGALPGEGAGECVAVLVRDEGVGMAPEIQARVFEPFFTTKGPGRGTGLGLSQVYGWARQSNGSVSIESAPGRGTTFEIRLPRTAKAPAAHAAPPQPDAAPQDNGLVLLVEDTPDVARVAAGMLHELGYDVVAAADADEALRRLAESPDIALVLSDIVMPGRMNGIALAREIRAIRPALPVVLASGYSREADEAGPGLPVLRKPYQLAELARALSAALAPAATLDRPAA